MSQQTKNSCAKASGNGSRNKKLKPENRGGGESPPSCLLGFIIVSLVAKTFKMVECSTFCSRYLICKKVIPGNIWQEP